MKRIEIGDPLEVALKDGAIVIAPAKRPRGNRSLEELVSRIQDDYRTAETDWGAPVGVEEW